MTVQVVGLEYMVKCVFFFFNDTATTEIYTLSLHDALPIYTMRDQSTRDVVGGMPSIAMRPPDTIVSTI